MPPVGSKATVAPAAEQDAAKPVPRKRSQAASNGSGLAVGSRFEHPLPTATTEKRAPTTHPEVRMTTRLFGPRAKIVSMLFDFDVELHHISIMTTATTKRIEKVQKQITKARKEGLSWTNPELVRLMAEMDELTGFEG